MPKGSTLESLFDELNERAEFEALTEKKILAERFRLRMAEIGMSVSELARRLRTSRHQVNRILAADDRGVTLATLFRASEALQLRLRLAAEERRGNRSSRSKAA